MILLALAVVLAVLDITRSITASALVITPLLESWSAISPSTLEAARQAVEGWGVGFIWDPVLLSILKLPSWLRFCARRKLRLSPVRLTTSMEAARCSDRIF